MDVAATAHAARPHNDALAGTREVCDLPEGLHRLGIELTHDGAAGNPEDEVLAVPAVPPGTLAMRAARGAEMMLEAIVDER